MKIFPILFVFILSCRGKDDANNLRVINFKEFNLFKLRGIDTIDKAYSKEYVGVTYRNGFPVEIKFNMPLRSVTLAFEDSFYLPSKKIIYEYYTSNFKGGQPGKHHLYSGYYEENKHLIFISLDDTIVCQTKTVPESRNFSFDMYIKKGEKILNNLSGEFDDDSSNSKLSRQDLYSKWNKILTAKFITQMEDESILVSKLPPD